MSIKRERAAALKAIEGGATWWLIGDKCSGPKPLREWLADRYELDLQNDVEAVAYETPEGVITVETDWSYQHKSRVSFAIELSRFLFGAAKDTTHTKNPAIPYILGQALLYASCGSKHSAWNGCVAAEKAWPMPPLHEWWLTLCTSLCDPNEDDAAIDVATTCLYSGTHITGIPGNEMEHIILGMLAKWMLRERHWDEATEDECERFYRVVDAESHIYLAATEGGAPQLRDALNQALVSMRAARDLFEPSDAVDLSWIVEQKYLTDPRVERIPESGLFRVRSSPLSAEVGVGI